MRVPAAGPPYAVRARRARPRRHRRRGRREDDRRLSDLTPLRDRDPPAGEEARAALADALRRVAGGDRAAFEEVYRRTSAKLFGVCLRISGGHAEAEEALQDAYLSVWQRAAAFDESRGGAMTWLITLARNRAIDRRRAGGKLPLAPLDLADDVADEAPDAFALLEAEGEDRRLAACLARLQPRDARFLQAAFLEGATYAELAARAGQPLGTVKSRIRRALLSLRDCLA